MLWSRLCRYFQNLVSSRATGNGLTHEHLPFNGSSINFQKNDVPSWTGVDFQLDKLTVADHGLQKRLTINENVGATRCATGAIDANNLYRAWRDQLDEETIRKDRTSYSSVNGAEFNLVRNAGLCCWALIQTFRAKSSILSGWVY